MKFERALNQLNMPENDKITLRPVKLTKREKQILELIATGLTTPAIAEKWFLSEDTVEAHRRNILAKFEVSNMMVAVVTAIRMGIIS